ncbi:hypothetical protein C8Q80DRAFT_1117417 [Daedaleopsis nitida]|nr:hypothetical protein C8Q80DRAFT_1117417 [Daedaleopsis nitida]
MAKPSRGRGARRARPGRRERQRSPTPTVPNRGDSIAPLDLSTLYRPMWPSATSTAEGTSSPVLLTTFASPSDRPATPVYRPSRAAEDASTVLVRDPAPLAAPSDGVAEMSPLTAVLDSPAADDRLTRRRDSTVVNENTPPATAGVSPIVASPASLLRARPRDRPTLVDIVTSIENESAPVGPDVDIPAYSTADGGIDNVLFAFDPTPTTGGELAERVRKRPWAGTPAPEEQQRLLRPRLAEAPPPPPPIASPSNHLNPWLSTTGARLTADGGDDVLSPTPAPPGGAFPGFPFPHLGGLGGSPTVADRMPRSAGNPEDEMDIDPPTTRKGKMPANHVDGANDCDCSVCKRVALSHPAPDGREFGPARTAVRDPAPTVAREALTLGDWATEPSGGATYRGSAPGPSLRSNTPQLTPCRRVPGRRRPLPTPTGGWPTLHRDDPEAVIRNIAAPWVDTVWKTAPLSMVLVEPFNANHSTNLRVNRLIAAALKGAITAITGAVDFQLIPPELAPGINPSDKMAPVTWAIRDLPEDATRTLVAGKVWSLRTISFIVHPRAFTMPTWLMSLEGFVDDNPRLIRETVAASLHEPAMLEQVIAMVARPGMTRELQEAAAQQVLASLSVDVLTLDNGNIIANVFMNSPTDDVHKWRAWVSDLRSRRYGIYLTAFARARPVILCAGCKGADHPSHLCPFSALPGWRGPRAGDPARSALHEQRPPAPPPAARSRSREPSPFEANARGHGEAVGEGITNTWLAGEELQVVEGREAGPDRQSRTTSTTQKRH